MALKHISLKIFTTAVLLNSHFPTFVLLMAGRVREKTTFTWTDKTLLMEHFSTAFIRNFKNWQYFFAYRTLHSQHPLLILQLQYLINTDTAMARKVLGCHRATRLELLRQWTLAQKWEIFLQELGWSLSHETCAMFLREGLQSLIVFQGVTPECC